jgi:primosomal protein N' (replication factor Y)
VGIGTQGLQEQVEKQFPHYRTLRWDRDVTRAKNDHERILQAFMNREADILIGTQMIAKGLDLPAVTLVGVISADISLNLPDYRSSERTYQLLMQVAGRAGRGSRPGRVIIQTYDPGNPAIAAAATYSGPAFYARELESRRRLGYPPFGEVVRLLYAHTSDEYAQREAFRLRRSLDTQKIALDRPNIDIVGPAPAFVGRLRGRFRWQVLLRGDGPGALLEGIHLPQGWTVDVDPVSLL